MINLVTNLRKTFPKYKNNYQNIAKFKEICKSLIEKEIHKDDIDDDLVVEKGIKYVKVEDTNIVNLKLSEQYKQQSDQDKELQKKRARDEVVQRLNEKY